jgi:hypothetical protein
MGSGGRPGARHGTRHEAWGAGTPLEARAARRPSTPKAGCDARTTETATGPSGANQSRSPGHSNQDMLIVMPRKGDRPMHARTRPSLYEQLKSLPDFFFNDTATTEIYTQRYTLSLHFSLPIYM